ncbi:hypothetical protein DENSPDRAFT_690333 [Dentipellis sp. KUC8613]|nr:hypothetical protein DENSPDRAFT_690333 [Dentipellis sp. KUC8613]
MEVNRAGVLGLFLILGIWVRRRLYPLPGLLLHRAFVPELRGRVQIKRVLFSCRCAPEASCPFRPPLCPPIVKPRCQGAKFAETRSGIEPMATLSPGTGGKHLSGGPPPAPRRKRTSKAPKSRRRSASPLRRDPIPSIEEQLEAKYRKDEEFWATLSKERKERERRSEEQKHKRESVEGDAWEQGTGDPLKVDEERRQEFVDIKERYERLRKSADEHFQLVKDTAQRINAFDEGLRDVRRAVRRIEDERRHTRH